MSTKVLIVDPDVSFAIGIKKALEGAGGYRVTAFANGGAALDLIRAEPHEVAILDFAIVDMDIAALITGLRDLQPGLFILVTPRTQGHIARVPSLDTQGSVTKPYLARQLISVIKEAAAAQSRLAKKAKATPPAPATQPISTPVSPDFDAALATLPSILDEPPIQPDDTFRRHIAAMVPEKPATPTGLRKSLETVVLSSNSPISENATIGDLVSGKPLSDPPDRPPRARPAAPDSLPEPLPLEGIASAALDALDTMPLDTFSLKTYIDQVEQQAGKPLPKWVRAIPGELDQPSLGEPSFVEKAVPPILPQSVEATFDPPLEPFPTLWADPPTLDIDTPQVGAPPVIPTEPLPPELVQEVESSAEPVAEIALRLTQLSLQMASRATILTRDDQVVAVAGDLSGYALAGVVSVIAQAWQNTGDPGSAVMRYVQVPGVSDFLLYSTQSVDGLRLSMLFPAETPLRLIRKQAQQLIEALEKTPAVEDEAPARESEAAKTLLSRPTDPRAPEGLRTAARSSASVPPIDGTSSVYSFVWLPHTNEFEAGTPDLIPGWLNDAATGHSWVILGVDVQPTYLLMQLNAPANETPRTLVDTLMQATAERAGTANFWADAYYVVAQDRPIAPDEIAQFMNYRNMVVQHPDD